MKMEPIVTIQSGKGQLEMIKDLEFVMATYHQAPEIVKLVNSAYRGDSSKKGWTTEADLLDGQRTDYEQIMNLIEKTNSSILLAYQKKETKNLVACCELGIILDSASNQKKLYFGMFTVRPELQNSGIGKIFLNHVEDLATKWGCYSIEMTVITLRSELIAYYERRGFVKTQKKIPFPADPQFGIPKKGPLEMIYLEKKL